MKVKMRFILGLFVSAIFLRPDFAFAENHCRYELRGGKAFGLPTTRSVLSNWENGWTLALGMSFPIYSNIQIVSILSYQRFRHTGQNVQYALPDIVGIRSSVSGGRADVYEASLAFRFMASGKLIRPFLALGGGAYFMRMGEIIIKTWFEEYPQIISHTLYQGTGQAMTKGVFALGYGFAVPINPDIAIQFEGRFTRTFDGDDSFAYIFSTVQFRL